MLEVATLKRALLKNDTSRRGSSFVISIFTKANNAAAARTKPAFDFRLPHPQCGDSITVYTSAETATTESKNPVLSILCAFSFRESGIMRAPINSAIATMGMLMRNTEPHQKCSNKKPPATGPNATAIPDTADHKPMAFARSMGSMNRLVMIARVAGKTSAAPMPIAPRQKISDPLVFANAAAALHAAKRTKPICSVRLRPYRSPMPPPANNNPANTSA